MNVSLILLADMLCIYTFIKNHVLNIFFLDINYIFFKILIIKIFFLKIFFKI